MCSEQQKCVLKLQKYVVTSSKQIPHDFCKATLGSDWLVLFQYGQNEDNTQEREQGKARKVKTWV